MSNQICFNVPSDIDAPKFQMFDRVVVQTRHGNREGVIVGLTYVCPLVALAEDIGYGWTYSISFILGLTPKQASKVYEPQFYSIPEDDLMPVEKLTAVAA